jgi:hypothetical protein
VIATEALFSPNRCPVRREICRLSRSECTAPRALSRERNSAGTNGRLRILRRVGRSLRAGQPIASALAAGRLACHPPGTGRTDGSTIHAAMAPRRTRARTYFACRAARMTRTNVRRSFMRRLKHTARRPLADIGELCDLLASFSITGMFGCLTRLGRTFYPQQPVDHSTGPPIAADDVCHAGHNFVTRTRHLVPVWSYSALLAREITQLSGPIQPRRASLLPTYRTNRKFRKSWTAIWRPLPSRP